MSRARAGGAALRRRFAPSPDAAGRAAGARPPAAVLSGRRAEVAAVALVALLSWRVTTLVPAAGLDPSWVIGLSLAISRGLSFGRQVVFTYGPLGLVDVPLDVSPGTLVLGLVGAALIQLGLAAVIVRSLRPRFGLLGAALLALIAMLLYSAAVSAAALDGIAFGFVAITLTVPPERAARSARLLAIAGGALAGLALLVKLDDGIAVGAIVLVGVLGARDSRRNVVLLIGSVLVTAVVAWLALGQPISALPDYVRYGVDVVRGYVDAMGFDAIGVGGEWQLLVTIASGIVLAAAAWRSLAASPRRAAAALAAAVLLVHYFTAREAFVRYDPSHATALCLLAPVALMIPWRDRGVGLAAATALAVAALALLGGAGVSVGRVFNPTSRAGMFFSDLRTMFSPGGTIADARAQIRAADAMPAQLEAELDGHCVDAEPTEVAIIFANPRWRWCPIGVLQTYTAYTTALDDLDAAGYADARTGPDRVVRELGQTIDRRNPVWESPAAMLSLLCHFAEIGRDGPWQVLARIPDRCGRPRVIADVDSTHPNPITLPAPPPGMVVLAEVHGLQVRGLERLRTLFGRASIRTLTINGSASFRVVPDTLTDGLILDVPTAADYAAPFKLSLSARTLSASIAGKPAAFSVTLIGVPIRPARGG
jgi:hypothetical protein